jgi:hypothetical protein
LNAYHTDNKTVITDRSPESIQDAISSEPGDTINNIIDIVIDKNLRTYTSLSPDLFNKRSENKIEKNFARF